MATDIEKLVVQLSADVRGYQREMQKAVGITDRRRKQIESSFQRMNKSLDAAFTRTAQKLAGVFAVAGSLRGAQQLIDTATRVQNSLKVAGIEGENLKTVYDALFASAQKNAVPIEAMVTLFSRASASAKELGASQEELIGFTDKIGVALRVSGQSAEESAGALLQLSQILGGGKVQAEEYNSLLDGGRPILQAVAAGLKEAGGSVSSLTALVKTGKVSSEAFFRAFIAGSPQLEKAVASSESTISQRLIRLQNVLIDAAGRFNKSSQASKVFGTAIDTLAADINAINFDSLISQIQAVVTALNNGAGSLQSWAASVGAAIGADRIGEAVVGALSDSGTASYLGGALKITSSKIVGDRINQAFDQPAQNNGGLTPDAIRNSVLEGGAATTQRTGRLPAAEVIKPVSLADYALPASGESGGKKAVKATPDSRFADDIQAVKDRTAALVEEQKIVGLSYEAQEKRRMALDLEQTALAELREEARKKGQTDLDSIKLSDGQREKIEAASAAYAQQAAVLRKLEDQQQRNEEAAGEFYDAFKSGAIDAITGAEDLGEALSNLAKKFGDLFLNAAFDGLFKPASGGESGGLFGGIFSSLASSLPGRERGGPVSAGRPYIVGEKRPEVFVPGTSGRIVPQVPAMPSLSGSKQSGMSVSAMFAPQIDARGASVEAVARLEQVMARQQADFSANVVQTIRKANQGGMKFGKFH